MNHSFGPSVASAPCLLGDDTGEIIRHDVAPAKVALLNGLSRAFGICLNENTDNPETRFLGDLAGLFQQNKINAETSLERHDRPWGNVYLIQYGILRLYRESASGKVAIHHFFAEGDLVWPVFGRSRTVRNTLCLTSVLPATVWVADFAAFRAAIQNHGDGLWQKFALVLTEELAELTCMREYRRQTMQATERYALMLDEYPELVKRVPDNQLAAWLGVVPATFSRLKSLHAGGSNRQKSG